MLQVLLLHSGLEVKDLRRIRCFNNITAANRGVVVVPLNR